MNVDAALDSGADALLLDLDGASAREMARQRARAFLETARRRAERPALFARVAPASSAAIDADLAALMPAAPDGVVLEDSRGRASVEQLSAKLAVWEAEAGLIDGATRIVALAARPAGVFGLGGYAGCSRRLAGLAFEGEALRAVMGAQPLALARSLLLLGAAAAGVPAIDGPFSGADEAGLRADCHAARQDGFAGKMAGDAGHVEIIDEIFGA
jgi:citrate lyase subunit beta/citryl-CoA lyase